MLEVHAEVDGMGIDGTHCGCIAKLCVHLHGGGIKADAYAACSSKDRYLTGTSRGALRSPF
jgi:hypothetical protein